MEPEGRPREGPTPQGRVPPTGGPQDVARDAPWVALLDTVFICPIKNCRKFSSNSKNISRSNFLQQKQHKNRELVLGILSIG